MNSKYYFSFLGGHCPIVRKKIKTPSERHLLRVGQERTSEMVGTFQIYYVNGLPAPLTKVNMEVTLFISKLTYLFKRQYGKANPNELWVYYGDV